ncbi:cytochrome C oxidase subunit II [Cohnella thailandensis]|jgi:Heme/copper-type cytochrome/quinol oxidases, subunit 2|uniref:Cytochrome C oxidase subunit II n=1 Tax=Cohnella thailandensis TaxID=557557 RepID=A0A841TAI3_9BACL|nr:cytochrome C oxidase subunit II [Cohnella thailandensis]MBB6638231.1 cytochrome C oxidase subunit II [Cohnella thailandensis]MBP1977792.1 cytochrome c oxidase subunit 2 [Cohnella thailandensis]
MFKWIMPVLIVIACLFGVYLLADGLPEKPKEEHLAEGTELLKITATNFEFNEGEYHVKAGTPYVLSFSNSLGTHGAEIADLNINLTKDNPRVEYTFDKPGTYEMHCSIMCGQGHSTMTAKIIVE